MTYDPREHHLDLYKWPTEADEGLEFVYISKLDPSWVRSIDPVVSHEETETHHVVRWPGTLSVTTTEIPKDEVISWELRKFTRDEDGNTPPPNKAALEKARGNV